LLGVSITLTPALIFASHFDKRREIILPLNPTITAKIASPPIVPPSSLTPNRTSITKNF